MRACTLKQLKLSWPLERQTKIAADDILIFLLLSFEENKAWFFMWILCLDSLETSSFIFTQKQWKKYLWIPSAAVVIGALRVDRQLQPALGNVTRVNP